MLTNNVDKTFLNRSNSTEGLSFNLTLFRLSIQVYKRGKLLVFLYLEIVLSIQQSLNKYSLTFLLRPVPDGNNFIINRKKKLFNFVLISLLFQVIISLDMILN